MSDGGIYNIANNTDADANDVAANLYKMLGLTNPTNDELELAIINKINNTKGYDRDFFIAVYGYFFNYDVDNFTDDELYRILDLSDKVDGSGNVDDDSLENAIINKINNSSGELRQFNMAVYGHFFDLSGTDLKSTGYQAQISYPNDQTMLQVQPSESNTIPLLPTQGKSTRGAPVIDLSGTGFTDVKKFTAVEQTKAAAAVAAAAAEKTTHNVDYVKDNLNPIKRETMFKMISIDSQFRENARTTPSTNFALNLSTSIENVISIKLYSINIPYAWYTINDSVGSNFFYIKGASPGINNGNHDIKIEIESGNYTQKRLIDKLNIDINNKKLIYTDTSLGNTELYYNEDNAKARIYVDVRKTFTEADYNLYFPDWTSPNIEGQKGASIPSFLGFNYNVYYPLLVVGDLKLINNSNLIPALNTAQYVIKSGINDSTNNSFRVVQYIGPSLFHSNSTIINDISISLTGFSDGNKYTRNELIEGINSALAKSNYLDSEFTDISYITVETGDYDWVGHTHFELGIKLNRFKTQNVLNAKIAVIFPDETFMTDDTTRIWTGRNSCFGFPKLINELSEIISETATTVTNYVLSNNANNIIFTCINPVFDVSQNTYTALIPASSVAGYTLSELKNAINASLKTMNDETIVTNLENGVFNITQTNPTTYFDISGDKAFFQFNITKTFDQTSYIIDLSNCFLSKAPFNFGGVDGIVDNLTSSNFILDASYSPVSSFTIYPGEYIKYSPKKNPPLYGNQNQSDLYVQLNTTYTDMVFTFGELANYINNIFDNTQDPETNKLILRYSELSVDYAAYKFYLNLRIQKSLSNSDYSVSFNSSDTINPWTTIKLLPYYDLSLNSSDTIYGTDKVYDNTMTVKAGKNTVVFKPYFDGVADDSGANDIVFTVPVDLSTGTRTYTRAGLVNILQTQFNSNPLTAGSTITVQQQSGSNTEYTVIKMHIKKQYQPSDYKLVFFDGISFRYCSTGNSGGNSIRTATWESTLGWLLGFHSFTEYNLNDFTQITDESHLTENYYNNIYTGIDSSHGGQFTYSYNSSNGQFAVQSDSIFNTYIYNYFMIVLDDFIQNHVNDGLVTITSLESDISLPTYASRVSYQCDPVTGNKVAVSASNKERLNLSAKQLYAMNQIIDARQTKNRSYTPGPVLKDIFAIIPLKLSGTQFGSTIMEFGGSLQNQDRKYFGPVRLQKLAVKLMNDKGDVVNLNGTNWSFTIICEILVKNS